MGCCCCGTLTSGILGGSVGKMYSLVGDSKGCCLVGGKRSRSDRRIFDDGCPEEENTEWRTEGRRQIGLLESGGSLPLLILLRLRR